MLRSGEGLAASTRPDPSAIRLQPLARSRIATLGPAGQTWLAALPGLLSELAERWSLRLGRPMAGGSTSYLVEAHRSDGTEAVLKVSMLPVEDEIAVLRRADGRGYVRLLEADSERGALLLARLGDPLDRSGRPVEEQLDLLADALRAAWLPPEANDATFDKAADLAQQLVDYAAAVVAAVDTRTFYRALDYADALRETDRNDRAVLHGDPHPGNLLRVRRSDADEWRFVDPSPFVADRAYDVGVTVRDFSGHLLADPLTAPRRLRGWCERIAAATTTDPARVWAWAFVERVSSGLLVASFGARRAAAPLLRSAEALYEGTNASID